MLILYTSTLYNTSLATIYTSTSYTIYNSLSPPPTTLWINVYQSSHHFNTHCFQQPAWQRTHQSPPSSSTSDSALTHRCARLLIIFTYLLTYLHGRRGKWCQALSCNEMTESIKLVLGTSAANLVRSTWFDSPNVISLLALKCKSSHYFPYPTHIPQ